MSYFSSSANALKYLGEKSFTGAQIMQTSIMVLFGVLLIYGGVIIVQDEDIFKKVYEGFDVDVGTTGKGEDIPDSASDNSSGAARPTASSSQLRILQTNLPEDLSLSTLAKNVGNLRKKSKMNSYFGWGMVGTGSLVIMFQLYNLIA